jgi:hypothetical protein
MLGLGRSSLPLSKLIVLKLQTKNSFDVFWLGSR